MQVRSKIQRYHQARLSRDARFDGTFFIAVKTTGIYCRPVCPAKMPKEENIEYFDHAHQATQAGYRPCLRCHPDSAPGSPVWKGVDTTLERAKRLIDNGALEQSNLLELSDRLGISDRYLRKLFDLHLGVSPKSYALFRQCEFAKNLLHQTTLPITDIAFAAGFNSIRRFNDCFKKQLLMNPSQVRKQQFVTSNALELKLYYRPPYNWQQIHAFLSARIIEDMEWVKERNKKRGMEEGEKRDVKEANCYGRTFQWQNQQDSCKGEFTAVHNEKHHRFDVRIEIDNLRLLKPVVNNIRRILDLDTDSKTIEHCLQTAGFNNIIEGIRLPGTWNTFEAGVRGVLGQQISVVAALKLVKQVVHELGERTTNDKIYFPSISSIAETDFSFLKMPGRRKQTLIDLAKYHLQHKLRDNTCDPNEWISINGIGPWTVNYAKMRGLSDPDVFLGGDLGIKKVMQQATRKEQKEPSTHQPGDPKATAPFRSYLTFQLWSQLS
ncbi:MAG: Ada metal-binding domain-containing protein [Thiotrichaceae bacterium]